MKRLSLLLVLAFALVALPAHAADPVLCDNPGAGRTKCPVPLNTANIPSLDAAKITSGDISLARIATSLAAGGGAVKGTVVTATTRVETPTIGTASGTQHALPTGTNEILAPGRGTAGQVLTSLGSGAAPAMADVITATSSSTFLAAAFNLTGASGVWQGTGLTRTLPSTGLYVVLVSVRTKLNVSANQGLILLKLTLDGVDVANSITYGTINLTASSDNYHQTPIIALVSATAGQVIELAASRNDLFGTPTYVTSQIGSSATGGYTTMAYFKIGN